MSPLPESRNPLDQRPRISLAGTMSTAVFAVFLLGLALLVHETHWLNNSLRQRHSQSGLCI